MDGKELDDLLEKTFSNVNSWLNFAEAKNVANIAFVIACIAAIFSLENRNFLLYTLCFILIISGICSFLSFIPKLGDKMIGKHGPILATGGINDDNLLFFERIKEYSGATYIKQICEMYFNDNNYKPTKYQLDLSNEIVYNSNNASRKYKVFKIAVYLDIIAFLLLVVFIILA